MSLKFIVPLIALAVLAGCSQMTGWVAERDQKILVDTPPASVPPPPRPAAATESARQISFLLPLSGKHAELGGALQNAATLALNDLNARHFELTFEDTESTPQGAAQAAKRATLNGVADILIGPVFADETRAALPVAQGAHRPLVTLSTDTSIAAPGLYIAGILPQDQARSIARFAAQKGLKNILVLPPTGTYGDLAQIAFVTEARRYNIQTQVIKVAGPISPPDIAPLFAPAGQRQGPPVDGVFLPLSAEAAAPIIRTLKTLPEAVTLSYLGMGLWDDRGATQTPELYGAYYAAPGPQARIRFEQNYAENFGAVPPRLASVGYDLTALAIMLARVTPADPYGTETLGNRSGFSGMDGLFRFDSRGIAERGLAILQIKPNGRQMVAPAPTQFDTP